VRTWDPLNGAPESHLKLLERKGMIEDIILVRETVNGKQRYAVEFKLKNVTEPMYLVTQRSKDEPRRFRDLTRLAAYLDEEFPNISKWSLTIDRTPT